MGELGSLVAKEIKDVLRDPHILVSVIIMPLLIFAVMGQVAGWGARQISEQSAPQALRLGFVDLDHGSYSAMLHAYLFNTTGSVTMLGDDALRDPVEIIKERGLDALVVVDRGFSENISRGLQGVVVVYSVVRELGFTATARLSSVDGLIKGFASLVQASVAAEHGINPAFIKRPVTPVLRAWTGSRFLDLGRLNILSGMMFAFAFTPMIAIGLAAQMAAMSMGVEKEEKTLETLLSLPLSRRSIALSKLLGSLVVGLLATASYMLGFAYYMYMAASAEQGFGGAGSLVESYLTPWRITLLLAGFLAAVMLANTLAAVLGSLGSNVRSSQSLASVVWMMLFAIGFGLIYVSLDAMNPLGRILLSAVPLSPPYIVAKDLGGAYTGYTILSLLIHVAYIALAFQVLTRILGSEILLSGRGLTALFKSRLRRLLSSRGISDKLRK